MQLNECISFGINQLNAAPLHIFQFNLLAHFWLELFIVNIWYMPAIIAFVTAEPMFGWCGIVNISIGSHVDQFRMI